MKKLKRIGKWLSVLFLTIVILWIFFLGILQTKWGQKWALKQLMEYVQQTSGTKIKVKKFHFSFPLNLSLEDLTFSQEEGPFLKIEKIELSCVYSSLLQGRLIFSTIRADNIQVLKRFNVQENKKKEPLDSWDIPPLPFYLKLQHIDFQNIKVNPDVIHHCPLSPQIKKILNDVSFNVHGLISNNPFKSALTAHLLIKAVNDDDSLTPFSLGIDTQHHQLSLSFHSALFPLDILDIDLPPDIKGHLAVYASGQTSAWQNLATDFEKERGGIQGHFSLSLSSNQNESPLLIPTLIGEKTLLKGRYTLNPQSGLNLNTFSLNSPYLSIKGEAVVNPDTSRLDSHFQGKISHLIKLKPRIGVPIKGFVNMQGHISGDLLSPKINLQLESPQIIVADQSFEHIRSSLEVIAEKTDLNGHLTLSADYLGTSYHTSSSLSWNQGKEFTLSNLEIASLNSHLQSNMVYSYFDCLWRGYVNANIEDLSILSPFLNSAISGEGELNLELLSQENSAHTPHYRLQLIGNHLKWDQLQTEYFKLNLHATPEMGQSSAFQMEGFLNGKGLHSTFFDAEQYSVHFSHHVEIAKREISALSIDWEAENIKRQETFAKKTSGNLQVNNVLKDLDGEMKWVFKDITTASIQMDHMMGSTTFKPGNRESPFEIKLSGFWNENFFLSSSGHWDREENLLQIQLNHLNGEFGPYPLELRQPLNLAFGANQIKLDHVEMQLGEAEIEGHFHLNQETIASQFKTNAVPSELFHFIAPNLPFSGRAAFEGKIEGSVHQPEGELTINLHHMQIIEDLLTKKPFISGTFFLTLNKTGVQLESEIKGIGETPLIISGDLPLTLNLDPLEFKTDQDLPFNLSLNAEGELDPYLHLFYNDTTNLSGQTKIGLNLSGQINAPQIKGNIDLIQGSFESLSTGALYHDIEAHLEGDGSQIVLTHFSAKGSENGEITATGTIQLDKEKQFPFSFDIHPSRILIIDSDYIDISISGELNLVGNAKGAKLLGELGIDEATIHLEESLPQKIKTIDIQYINAAEDDKTAHASGKKETAFPIDLNIKLNAPQKIRIEGNHVKSDWKGALLLTGTPDLLQLNGDLRLEQGEYDFNGKVFNLSQGNIHFAGAPDKKTSLYIVASKEIDRITAEIILKGPVNRPVISFRSAPPLSQREVLSYILFGRGISNITQDQGDQLSQSFISLNSSSQTKSGTDFLSRLRNNIGIDHLDFTTSTPNENPRLMNSMGNDHLDLTNNTTKENKEFGLQVGKQITENLKIKVNQSIASTAPAIAVEAKLRKNVKAEAEAGFGQDAPIRMSIKWKKDY